MTMTKKMTNTFREYLQRAILETYDLWHIWSEKWGDMTWLTKRQRQRQIQWKRQRQWQLQKHPQRTISETCDLWDTGYISDNWEQQSEHSQSPLNKEWQGQHSQFLRCLVFCLIFLPCHLRAKTGAEFRAQLSNRHLYCLVFCFSFICLYFYCLFDIVSWFLSFKFIAFNLLFTHFFVCFCPFSY